MWLFAHLWVFLHILRLYYTGGPVVALGLENKAIPDGRLSASSEWDKTHDVKQVRLNTVGGGAYGGAWSVRYNDANQWLQVYAGQVDYRFRITVSKMCMINCYWKPCIIYIQIMQGNRVNRINLIGSWSARNNMANQWFQLHAGLVIIDYKIYNRFRMKCRSH